MKPKLFRVLAIAATLAWSVPAQSFAQETPLPPPRTHAGPTMMSAKANSLQAQVAGEIDKANAAGSDVATAQSHKDRGDAALKIGHYRIAVAEYEAARKSLPAK